MADFKYSDLIRFTDKGIVKANFSEIVNALTNRMKEIYGYDIDITMTSADGIKIMDEATIIDKAFECIQEMYSNLDPNTASGRFLEILCSLSNVYRKSATSSKVAVYVTYVGVGPEKKYLGTLENPYMKLFDKNTGKTWTINEPFTIKNNMVNAQGQTVANPTMIFYADCDETGPIALPSNSLQLVEIDGNIEITQPNIAVLGENEESDEDLRVRRKNFKSLNSVSVLGGLATAILDVGGVEDVKIYNNDTNNAMVQVDSNGNVCVDDIQTIAINSIYIVVRYEETPKLSNNIIPINDTKVIVDNEKLGRTIFEQMTPGIHTNECAGNGLNYGVSGEYNYALYPNFTKSIYWKICKPYLSDATTRYFTIKIVQLNNYKGDNIEPVEIAKAIGNYMNKLKIAQCFNTYADIVPLVINAGLTAFGEQTYYCVSDSVVFRHNSLDIKGNVSNFGCTYFSFQGIVSGAIARTTSSGITTISFKVI